MQCPKCQHENPSEALFCRKCGTKLPSVCPCCGNDISPQDKFCMKCGTKLDGATNTIAEVNAPTLEDVHAQSKSWIPDELAKKYMSAEQQATGENRPITALFADISGFTPLSNTQSSEAMFQLVQDCFRELVGIVARYEGSISGFRGDALLALFGAPILHENDAERAILVALDMCSIMQERGLDVSIGLNTAMMTVGEIQTQLHSEYTAYGTDINLAKRLQEAAEPGQILVGTGTHRLTRRVFDFEAIHDLSVKGFTQTVTAYSVQQMKAHPEKLRGIEGLRAKMIGREHEFSDLKEAADLWLAGQGQMVSIVGEAGIGKSRLVSELREYLSSKCDKESGRQGDKENPPLSPLPLVPMSLLEGRCVSIGQPISYWPFLDILHTWFGLVEDDTEAERVQKVREHIQELLSDRCDDILPYLGHLMNLKFGDDIDTRLKGYSPEQVSHHTMMRLRDIFVALSQKQKLLLILEDLHWADDLSLDLVSLLMDELMAHPLMLLCVYRPEQKHRVWRLGSQAQRKCLERYREIQLQKLPPAYSRRLVQELLDIDDLPEGVRGMILTKSEGNPFFIEEVIRSLIEREVVYREDERWKAKEGIAHISVPDTIQSVVLSRVDRLASEAKYVLQCASVIGRLFKHKLLEHLTQKQQELDGYITEFEERDLIYEERTIPELEYAFKHALTQEATYQGILEQRRKSFHREVARGIERLYHERIQDFYEELAYHWERSGDNEKTLEYLIKAGKKAAKQYLNDAAINYYTQALELAEEIGISGDRLAKIYELRGFLYDGMCFYEEGIDDISKAAGLYKSGTKRANMYQAISRAYEWSIGDRDEAGKYARMAIEAVDPDDKSRDASLAYEGAGTVFIHSIDLGKGEKFLRKALSISEEMGYKDLLATQYTLLAWFYDYSFRWRPDDEYWLSYDEDDMRKWQEDARKKALLYLKQIESEPATYVTVAGYGGLYLILALTFEDEKENIYLCQKALRVGARSSEGWTMVLAALQLGGTYQGQGKIDEAIEVY